MKQNIFSGVKRVALTLLVSGLSMLGLEAVPAYRGWLTMEQPDGTTIKIQQTGDEFYHYAINRDGKQVKQNAEGFWVEVGEAPTEAVAKARRAKALVRRQRQAVGTKPNLAPKGVVILANFKDTKMQSSHTQAVFDELCNSANCTVNKYNNVNYPSAAQYFADQSNGSYRPVFDVYGPVDLSRNVAYYGTDNPGEDDGDDQHATDAVVEACILANEQFTINWADYDSDNDGKVDFVYLIYAGKGQADGGSAETIWPHNWDVTSAISYKYCTYTNAQRTLGGKKIDNYACSAELSGSNLSGIGTLCHEFGHVMGLPDLYDTDYGTNYKNELTPNEWDIMDGGSYNGNGHCPPNYDPWEKFFFGWVDPVNLGNEGANGTLNANGTSNYNVYQVNSSGTKQSATTSGWCYYLENRQKSGWDKFVPAHGMVIWKVNFSSTAWSGNKPNNTANDPKFTIVCSSGTKIGDSNGSGNVFGGSSKVTSWSDVTGKPVTDVLESAGVITFKYKGGAAGHKIEVNAVGCTIAPSAQTVENGVGFTATITPKSNQYTFSSLSVTLGSTTLTEGTHYTLSADKKTLTVPGSSVTGDTKNDITITAVWQKTQCSYDILQDPEGCTISSESGTVATNSELNLTITANSGFSVANPACWEVEMGEQKLEYGEGFTYNSETGAFRIAKVVDDVAIYLYPGYVVTWQALGVEFAQTIAAGGKLILPVETPVDCVSGKSFVGWYHSPYEDEAVAPTFAKNGDAVASAATYYAVYAGLSGGGEAEVASVTFLTAGSDGSADLSSDIYSQLVDHASGISSYSGNKLYLGTKGMKIGASKSNGYISLTLNSAAEITAVKVEASQYSSDTGKLEVEIDETSLGQQSPSSDMTFTAEPAVAGTVVTLSTTSKRAYVKSISILSGGMRQSGYTTSCTLPDKHEITIQASEHGSVTTTPADSAYYGAQVSVTITPDEGYTLATLSVIDAENQDVTTSGEGNTHYFKMPDSNVSVAATFAEIPKYAVRFLNNGEVISSEQYYLGETADKPANPTAACEDYTFVGWWTAELAKDNTDAKTWITNFTVSGAQDYYAVFSKTEAGDEEQEVASVTFKIGSDGSTEYTSDSNIKQYLVKSASGISSYTGSKLYTGAYGVKMGSGSSAGSITLTLSAKASVKKVVVNASQYSSDTGELKVEAGSTSFGSQAPAANLEYKAEDPIETNTIKVSTTTKRAYVSSISILAGGGNTTYYSTQVSCQGTDLETVTKQEPARKILRNGQILILRGEAVYTLTGTRIE